MPRYLSDSQLTVSTDVTPDDWNLYVEKHPDATADHLWGWRHVFERVLRQDCCYLAARRNGAIVGVLPLTRFRSLLFGRSLVSVPYLNYGGILASDPGAVPALVDGATEVARRFGATHIELRHQRRLLPDAPCRDHKVRMVLELPASSDELWASMDRKVRNQVRKAQKEGLVAIDGSAELLEEFYSVFARNMRDLGTPVYPPRMFFEALALFGDDARLHVVRHDGMAVGGALAIRFRDSVIVPWASSLREFRQLCPNMLLYWTMIRRATEAGLRRFDFGRSTRGAGTHQFKLQWGAREVPLYWEYVLLSREDLKPGRAFDLAIATWQRLPLWLTNRIGPHIVRNIP